MQHQRSRTTTGTRTPTCTNRPIPATATGKKDTMTTKGDDGLSRAISMRTPDDAPDLLKRPHIVREDVPAPGEKGSR